MPPSPLPEPEPAPEPEPTSNPFDTSRLTTVEKVVNTGNWLLGQLNGPAVSGRQDEIKASAKQLIEETLHLIAEFADLRHDLANAQTALEFQGAAIADQDKRIALLKTQLIDAHDTVFNALADTNQLTLGQDEIDPFELTVNVIHRASRLTTEIQTARETLAPLFTVEGLTLVEMAASTVERVKTADKIAAFAREDSKRRKDEIAVLVSLAWTSTDAFYTYLKDKHFPAPDVLTVEFPADSALTDQPDDIMPAPEKPRGAEFEQYQAWVESVSMSSGKSAVTLAVTPEQPTATLFEQALTAVTGVQFEVVEAVEPAQSGAHPEPTSDQAPSDSLPSETADAAQSGAQS